MSTAFHIFSLLAFLVLGWQALKLHKHRQLLLWLLDSGKADSQGQKKLVFWPRHWLADLCAIKAIPFEDRRSSALKKSEKPVVLMLPVLLQFISQSYLKGVRIKPTEGFDNTASLMKIEFLIDRHSLKPDLLALLAKSFGQQFIVEVLTPEDE